MRFLLLLSILFIGQVVFAQKKLIILGLEDFSFSYKRQVIDLAEAKKIAFNLKAELIGKGYLSVSADTIIEDENQIEIRFLSPKKYQWVKLKKGNIEPSLLAEIDFNNRIFFNRPFQPKGLQSFFERSIVYLENNGYPFASIQLDSIIFLDSVRLEASINLKKNQFYEFDSLLIKGKSTISKSYLLRHLGLREGSPYNESSLSQISTRIRELPFVKEVSPSQIQFFENTSKLLLFIDKQRASRFDGILGLLTEEKTGKIELTGDIDLNLINAFNRGESIQFNWRKLKGNNQDLKMGMIYPYFLNSAFGLDFKFKLFKRDTTFIDLTTRIGINYNLRRAEFIRLYYQQKTSSLLSKNSLVALNTGILPQLADVTINSFGVGYSIQRLDYKFNPRSGFAMEGNFSVGQKKLKKILGLEEKFPLLYQGINLSTTQYNGEIDVQKFFKIGGRSSILFANKSASVYAENIFFNELLRIGGLKILRGFDEESISASTYTIFTAEFRFLLDKNSYFSLFSDGGYYEAKTLNSFTRDNPLGFGTGVTFETKAGIFTVNYAIGKQLNNPIDFRAAKIHFGFVNFF